MKLLGALAVSASLVSLISLSYLGLQISYGQSEQQNFTAPKFGISMQYPADWTFAENVYEDRDYRPDDPSAYLGTFCPTASLGSNQGNPSCSAGLDVPVRFEIFAYKLKAGITADEFYDERQAQFAPAYKISGNKKIEINNIKISGVPAIERIDKIGGGSMAKALEAMGQETTKGKAMEVYVVNGDTGYRIWAGIHDEQDYDTYLPTIQKMIDSVKIE